MNLYCKPFTRDSSNYAIATVKVEESIERRLISLFLICLKLIQAYIVSANAPLKLTLLGPMVPNMVPSHDV